MEATYTLTEIAAMLQVRASRVTPGHYFGAGFLKLPTNHIQMLRGAIEAAYPILDRILTTFPMGFGPSMASSFPAFGVVPSMASIAFMYFL